MYCFERALAEALTKKNWLTIIQLTFNAHLTYALCTSLTKTFGQNIESCLSYWQNCQATTAKAFVMKQKNNKINFTTISQISSLKGVISDWNFTWCFPTVYFMSPWILKSMEVIEKSVRTFSCNKPYYGRYLCPSWQALNSSHFQLNQDFSMLNWDIRNFTGYCFTFQPWSSLNITMKY